MDTDADRALVARQLGREPRAFRRVAVRCPFGRPAVTEQHPYAPDGEPFPTTYYVTCRHLVAASPASRPQAASSAGPRVREADAELAASRARADDEQRRIRRELAGGETGRDGGASLELGVGGSGSTGSLKCLHAHAAFALARPGYELGERILARGGTALAIAVLHRGELMEALELSRHEWDDGHRRLEAERGDPTPLPAAGRARSRPLTDELRRRVGGTYSLAELAAAYRDADAWARAAVADRAPGAGLAARPRPRPRRGLPRLPARRERLPAVTGWSALAARSSSPPTVVFAVGIAVGEAHPRQPEARNHAYIGDNAQSVTFPRHVRNVEDWTGSRSNGDA